MERTKYLVWIILLIGCFGCNEKRTKISSENLFAELQVDSIQFLYTTEWFDNKFIDTSTVSDSIKKQFLLLNFPSDNFDDISYIKTKLPNAVTLSDSIVIKKVKDCFGYYSANSDGISVRDCGLPIYRDILIIYSEGKKTAQLKICFECNYISVYPKEFNEYVNINDTTIYRLRKYFNKNVHPINH